MFTSKKMYRINDTPYCLNNIAFDVNVNITKENIEYNVVFNNINSTLELLKNNSDKKILQ